MLYYHVKIDSLRVGRYWTLNDVTEVQSNNKQLKYNVQHAFKILHIFMDIFPQYNTKHSGNKGASHTSKDRNHLSLV